MKCNLAPIGLGLQGASADVCLQNKEGGTGRARDAQGIERVVGCEVILPHTVFY